MVTVVPASRNAQLKNQELMMAPERFRAAGEAAFGPSAKKQQLLMQEEQENRLLRRDLDFKKELLEHEYGLKSGIAQKEMTPLQQAQSELAKQRLQNLQSENELFQSITGNQQKQPESYGKKIIGEKRRISPELLQALSSLPEEQPSFGDQLMSEGQQPEQRALMDEEPEIAGNRPNQFTLREMPDDKLDTLAMFEGQPGAKGVIGTAAANEKERRKESSKIAQKEKIEFHKESEKYDEKILDSHKKALNQKEAVKTVKNALMSGNVRPQSLTNILRGFGSVGNKIANGILNKDEATVLGSIPYLIEGWKDIFGVRLSDADLRVIQDKLPDIGKSLEANKAFTDIIEKYADMAELRYDIAKRIKKENKGIRPLGYADIVESELENSLKPVMIRNPNTGNIVPIPAYKASAAVRSGRGEIVNE